MKTQNINKSISHKKTPQIRYDKLDLFYDEETTLPVKYPFRSYLLCSNDTKIHYDTINNTINTISMGTPLHSVRQAKTRKKRRILQTYARPQRTVGYSETDDFEAAVEKNEEVSVLLECKKNTSLTDFEFMGRQSEDFSKNNNSNLHMTKTTAKNLKRTRMPNKNKKNKLTDSASEEENENGIDFNSANGTQKKRKYNKGKATNKLLKPRPKRLIKSRMQKQEEQDELDEKNTLYVKQMKKLKAAREKEKNIKEAIRKLEKGLPLTSSTISASSLLAEVSSSDNEDFFDIEYTEAGEDGKKDDLRPLYPQAPPSKSSRKIPEPNFNQFNEDLWDIPPNVLIRKLSIKDTVAKTSDELRREAFLLEMLKKRAEEPQQGDEELKDRPEVDGGTDFEQVKDVDFEGYDDFIIVGADAYSPEMLHEMQDVKKGRKIRKDYVLPPEPSCVTKDLLLEGRKWRAARMYLLNPLRTSLREVCKENNVSVPTLITYMDATRVARSLMTGKYSGSSVIRDSTFNNRGKNKFPKEVRDQFLKRAYEKLNEAREKTAQITTDLGLRDRHRGLRLFFDSRGTSGSQLSPGPSASSNSSAFSNMDSKRLSGSPLGVEADFFPSSSSSSSTTTSTTFSSSQHTNQINDSTVYDKNNTVELYLPNEDVTIVDVTGNAKSEELSGELKPLEFIRPRKKKTPEPNLQRKKIQINDVSFEPSKVPDVELAKKTPDRAFIEENPAKTIFEKTKQDESFFKRRSKKRSVVKHDESDEKTFKEPIQSMFFKPNKRLLNEINQNESVPKTINIVNENSKKAFVVKPYELDKEKLKVPIPTISLKPGVQTFSKSSSKGDQLRKLFKRIIKQRDELKNDNSSEKDSGTALENHAAPKEAVSFSTEQPKDIEKKDSLESVQILDPVTQPKAETQIDKQTTE
ncbi:hypothetical protein ACO0RG_001492 [Hanseniaspora osmophila]